jgi:PDZ domain/CHAT domain
VRDYPLWRATRTIFFFPLPYRVISFARRRCYDALALAPAAAAGVWWVSVSKGTDVPADSVATADSEELFLLSHHVARFFPTLIGFILCVILVTAGRTAAPRRTVLRGVFVATRIHGGVVLFLAGLALIDLILVPGPILERAIPPAVAAGWAWLVRIQIYGRVRVVEATGAGFRPPVRVAFSRSARKAVQPCLSAAWGGSQGQVRTGLVTAIGYFAALADPRMQAWCLARAVDYNLWLGALDEAEELLVGTLGRSPVIQAEPALVAERGLFQLTVGSLRSARTLASAAHRCETTGRRVPYRLRTLMTEAGPVAGLEAAADPALRVRGWNGPARARLVWNRHYAILIRDVLARTYALQRLDPELAMALARKVERLIDDLGKKSARADLDSVQALELALLKAAARERIADILAADSRLAASSAIYAESAESYRELGQRQRAGLASARAATLALMSGRAATDTGLEARLLSAMLIGLQALEYDRGRLQADEHRYEFLAAREALHREAFLVLADRVRFHHGRAAELALWLLESTHRSKLAERIASRREAAEAERALSGGSARADAAPSGETLDRLRSPVDVADIQRAIAGRVALYYRCERLTAGWQVYILLISPAGISLSRVGVAPGPADVTSVSTAAGILDALSSPIPGRLEDVHNNVPLRAPGWRDLAEALLPAGLGDALAAAGAPGAPVPLLVIPDWPLSAVPFSGLRLRDGSLLAERADVIFMPNLLAFTRGADWAGGPAGAGATVLTHLGPTRFAAEFERLRRSPEYASVELTEVTTSTRADLDAGLADAHPDIAVVSQHGQTAANPADRFIQLSDGSTLTERDAEEMRWPPTVILGACWASEVAVRAGEDAVGMPTACLLGRAVTVIGGQANVDNDEVSAAILAGVVLEAAAGRHPALALHAAVRRHLAAVPGDRHAPPAQWANLTAWTTQPPAAARRAEVLWQSWTASASGGRSFVDFGKVFTRRAAGPDEPSEHYPAMPMTSALLRALDIARTHSRRPAVTTLDLLTAILAADNADWTSFSVAAGFGPPSWTQGQDRESGLPLTDLVLDLDHRIRVTRAVANSLARADRLAFQLRDDATAPAHVVYGFLAGESGDAARWMRGSQATADEITTVLSDLVFGVDLPSAASLRPVPGDPNQRKRTARVRVRPPADSELATMIRQAASGPEPELVGTLDLAAALASACHPAWECLGRAGFSLAPPEDSPFAERDRGGTRENLGNRRWATVTLSLSGALRSGAALAAYLRAAEMNPAHVLYGILLDADSDATRWITAARPDGKGPLTLLAEQYFQRPLPPPGQLPSVAEARDRASVGSARGSRARRWLGRTTGKIWAFQLTIWFLALISVTMSLADINTSQPTASELAANEAGVTGSVRLAGPAGNGQTLPATLVGKLSSFYVEPAMHGLLDIARQVFRSTPGDLSGLYLFVVPAPAREQPESAVTLGYRGADYPAQLICGGAAARLFCMAVARLPSGPAPGGISWQSESILGGKAGAPVAARAVVYPLGARPDRVAVADLLSVPPDLPGFPQQGLAIAVRSAGGRAIRPFSPVVLDSRSRGMPTFGVAVPPARGGWYLVYPTSGLDSYAQGIADRLAGPEPGSIGYAGIAVTSVTAVAGSPGTVEVDEVVTGSPADYAGFQYGDEILAIDGRDVSTPDDIRTIIGALRPGTRVPVVIWHDGSRRTLVLTVGYEPA